MASRPDLPALQGSRPTVFNHYATSFGVILGAAAYAVTSFLGAAPLTGGAIVAGATLAAPLAAALVAGAIGAVIGGVAGKAQMRREQVTGRVVQEPSFFNKGLINGVFIGGAALLATVAAPALGITALPALGSAAAGALLVVPAILGSFWTSSGQAQEVAYASRMAQVARVSAQAERARAQGYGQYLNNVNPEQSAALEAGMRDSQAGRSFRDEVQASRDIANPELAR